ncbi:uncharacterized protein LOC128502367 [Spea bombifrons]|uniref:uncharacterized protein LOC128502367 n=1 Tax=Spea bombifrons TaxID=233779 RepID=UPI00234A7BAB|nr:uncharacterized protein LOC128502367 [Spea bombifrons]
MVGVKPSVLLVLCWAVISGESHNLIKNAKEQKVEGQLLISEVNTDNPGLDTTEFVELYHTSGHNVSLDGYTLVFYNGKTNTAYMVLNLTGLSTDKNGFFLIGSLMVNPRPSIIVPKNTIQNGPDAIVIYFGNGPYRENMKITRDGLVDALVHKAKATEQADILQTVLTPGVEAFLEDSSFHTSDESIGRCLEIDGQWTFRMTHISPGSENFCKGFPAVVISEVSSPYAQYLYVEIQGPPSTPLSGLVLAFIRGDDQNVYYTTDIRGYTNQEGFYVLENEKYSNRAQQSLPDSVRLFTKGGGAVALYLGKTTGILPNTSFPTSGLVDAVVYGDYEDMGPHPLQDLTLDHPIIYWHSGDVNISASRCSVTVGEPAIFMLRGNSPGQTNDCPPQSSPRHIMVCFKISDCSQWTGNQILLDLLSSMIRSLQTLCSCNLPLNVVTDASLSCRSDFLTLNAKQNTTLGLQGVDLTEVLHKFVTSGSSLTVGNRNAAVMPTCSLPTTNPTKPPVVVTDASPASGSPGLLISEVNPNTPGSAEDTEYVELYHPKNTSVGLTGYWLVFYNGKNNMAYYTLDLKGFQTDKNGYFLVGNPRVSPKPHVTMPINTLQNGADAVALYYRPQKPFKKNMAVTSHGLVDAVVYVSQVGDDADGLLKVLTPGQKAVHEDERFHQEDESLSRCYGLMPLNQSGFKVTRLTPLSDNDCQSPLPSHLPPVTPVPPETSSPSATAVISEAGVLSGFEPYDFIELKGTPGSELDRLTMVLYGAGGKVYNRFGLEGTIGANGYYLISIKGKRDQLLPSLSRPGLSGPEALALYAGSPEHFPVGSSLTKKGLLDAIVYSMEEEPTAEFLKDLGKDTIILNEKRLVSVSLCPHPGNLSAPLMLPVTMPSPGSANLCPSSVTPIRINNCKDSHTDCSKWENVTQKALDSLKNSLSEFMQHDCSCAMPPAYIQDMKITCVDSRLSISSHVLSSVENQHLVQKWSQEHADRHFTLHGPFQPSECYITVPSEDPSSGSLPADHVALLVVPILLLVCGLVVLAFYLHKRRTRLAQNYTTIEMNPQTELISD